MPFGFGRRNSQQFKHIAHGLVPAATVAPRPAVPRTPPPRSPNPSPERPRSALAAAILMTSLTGRTVAIPHPRPRSYSESDSFGVKQESFIEPYATAAELGVGDSWSDHHAQRDRSPSPDLSDEDFADEDVVEILSDRNRKSADQFLEQSDEALSIAALYTVPNKGRKIKPIQVKESSPPLPDRPSIDSIDQIQVSESAPPLPDRPSIDSEKTPLSRSLDANESDMSSYEVAFQTSAHHELTSMQFNELKKRSLESPRRSPHKKSPRRNITEETTSDATDAVHQESVDHTKEIFDSLKSKSQYLAAENQTMSIQLKELKKQIKGMRLKLKEQEDENRRLKEDGVNIHEEGGAELLSLREQAQELVDENDALKMTVHRLNVELSRYQTKYCPLTQEENVKIGVLPMRGPPPPWLLDMKYLSPLLLAYEDRMREKDSIILAHEEQMSSFRARLEEVVQENEQLHQQLEKNRTITSKEWKQLQFQAKLVLEENQVLMKQFEVQQAKAKESHNRHVQEVSKLTKQLMLIETKKQNQEKELSEIQNQLEALRSRYDELKANLDGRIAAEEHVAMVNELKSHLQEERDKRHAEVEDLMGRLSTMQGEKKSLLLEKNGLRADNKTLEEELEMTQKTNRKYQKKIAILKQYLEEAMEKEVAAHQYLANLIHLAESITLERDQLVHMTKGLENEKHNVLNKILGGNVRLGQLEEKVKVYKKKAASKIEDIHHRLMEQEEDFAGKAARYQREMKHLQRLLLDRQETLDEVLQQKRDVEGELEIVWETTSQENRRMKELLTQS